MMPVSLKSLIALLLVLPAFSQVQAQTSAGTSIDNQHRADYGDSLQNNLRAPAFSNMVKTQVLGVCAPLVLPDGTVLDPGQINSSVAGSRSVLGYTVENRGNGEFTLPLNVLHLDGWNAQSIKIFEDLDKNGAVDVLDPEITAVTLKAGQSARVLVQIQTPFNGLGAAHFDLVASCTDTLSTKTDAANVARVVLTAASSVKLDKQMDLSQVKKGDEVTVTLKVTNTGLDDLQNVQVLDALDQTALQGLAYVPGTLKVVSDVQPFPGAIFFESGVQALSVIFDRIPRASFRTVEFKLKVLSDAALGDRVNVARVQGASATDATVLVSAEASYPFKVTYSPEIWLGPWQNPQATEMTAADAQSATLNKQNTDLCLKHTLLNAAPVSDTLTVSMETISPELSFRLLNLQGNPLPNPIDLNAGQSIDFQVCYSTSANKEGSFTAVLKAESKLGATPNRTVDQITVSLPPEIWLGPLNFPRAPELTAEDTVSGQIVARNVAECLEHTVLNAAELPDVVTLTMEDLTVPAVLGGNDVQVQFYQGTTLLKQPIKFSLPARGSENFRVCYTRISNKQTPFTIRLTATSDRGPVNRTLDVVTHRPLQPEEQLVLQKSQSVAEGTKLLHGDEYTYTLKLTNKLPFVLNQLQVTDLLDPNLDFQSAEVTVAGVARPDVTATVTEVKDNAGKRIATRLDWTIPVLNPTEVADIRFKVMVRKDARDGYLIDNFFTADAQELYAPVESNHVKVLIWSTALVLKKEADKKVVEYGDVITWTLTLTNPASTVTVQDVTIEDKLPRGLVYVAGSSRWKLENAGSANQEQNPAGDPVQQGQLLVWGESAQSQLPDLPAQSRLVLSFQTRVTPEVEEEIINTATALGCGLKDPNLNQCIVTVASNSGGVSTATVKVQSTLFKTPALLMGRVYIDQDQNRKFDPAVDRPIKNARLVLSSGRSIMTDAEGRYSVDGIQTGVWAIRLDPFSAPYTPLTMPEDRGKPGSRNMMVAGLTTVDFPLLAPEASLNTFRSTRLQYGPLVVQKTVRPVGNNEYIVTVKLTAQQDLPEFQLTDALPEGATLLEGELNPALDVLQKGELLLDYRIRFNGTWAGALTDPQVRWRYP